MPDREFPDLSTPQAVAAWLQHITDYRPTINDLYRSPGPHDHVFERIAEDERLRQKFDSLFAADADNLVWDSSRNGEWLWLQLRAALKGPEHG